MVSKVWHFKVTGSGYFPFDMLRYDRCWPTRETESIKLELKGYSTSNRTIEITGYGKPTIGRWNSFGWQVSEIRNGL